MQPIRHALQFSLAALLLLVSTTSASAATLYNINVTNAANNTSLGYISSNFNAYGEYTLGNLASALAVNNLAPSLTTNTPGYLFLGAIVGYGNTNDNLGTGSYNYAYLGGVSTSGNNSFTDYTGVNRNSQTLIWSVNGSQLNTSWVNTNNTAITPTIMLIQNFFVLTGDAAAFTARFGEAVAVNLNLQQVVTATPKPTAAEVPEPSTLLSAAAALASVVVLRRNRR